jgi:hypothetical protein
MNDVIRTTQVFEPGEQIDAVVWTSQTFSFKLAKEDLVAVSSRAMAE